MKPNKFCQRVKTAADIYVRTNPSTQQDIMEFVRWIYQQYGIAYEDYEPNGKTSPF